MTKYCKTRKEITPLSHMEWWLGRGVLRYDILVTKRMREKRESFPHENLPWDPSLQGGVWRTGKIKIYVRHKMYKLADVIVYESLCFRWYEHFYNHPEELIVSTSNWKCIAENKNKTPPPVLVIMIIRYEKNQFRLKCIKLLPEFIML